jgi:putative ABC transport system substrate-binding protein
MTAVTKKNWKSALWIGAVMLALWASLALVNPGRSESPRLRIGVLVSNAVRAPVVEELRRELARLGYDGTQVGYDVEGVEGTAQALPTRAARLVALDPDLLFTVGEAHTIAARQATETIPIVFAAVADPARLGVTQRVGPSRNLTGVSSQVTVSSGTRLDVLKEIAPGIEQVHVVVAEQERVAVSSYQALEQAARKRGITLVRRSVTSREEIERVIGELRGAEIKALYVAPSVLTGPHVALFSRLALEKKIPLVMDGDDRAEPGILISYAPDFLEVTAQAARLAAKILSGVEPSQLRIEAPEKYYLTLNLTTAKTIGVRLPPQALEQADRLVE